MTSVSHAIERMDSSAHTEIKDHLAPRPQHRHETAPRIRRLRQAGHASTLSGHDSSAHTEIKAVPPLARGRRVRQLRAYGD